MNWALFLSKRCFVCRWNKGNCSQAAGRFVNCSRLHHRFSGARAKKSIYWDTTFPFNDFLFSIVLLTAFFFVIRLGHTKEFTRLNTTARHYRLPSIVQLDNLAIRILGFVQFTIWHFVRRKDYCPFFNISGGVQTVYIGHHGSPIGVVLLGRWWIAPEIAGVWNRRSWLTRNIGLVEP